MSWRNKTIISTLNDFRKKCLSQKDDSFIYAKNNLLKVCFKVIFHINLISTMILNELYPKRVGFVDTLAIK